MHKQDGLVPSSFRFRLRLFDINAMKKLERDVKKLSAESTWAWSGAPLYLFSIFGPRIESDAYSG